MLTQEQILSLLRQNKAYLCREYGVKTIGIFGSYAKGCVTEESNIDLVVEFE